MKNHKMVLLGVFAFVLSATFVLATVSFAKSDKSSSQASQSKSERVKEFKNFEKPTKEKTNAAIHKKVIDEVSGDLIETAKVNKSKAEEKKAEKAAKEEGTAVDEQEASEEEEEEIAEELEEVAEEVQEAEEETVEAIEEVEGENKFKKLLVGTSYKNLGQLRSSLVHNRNQIRKLVRISDKTTDAETKTAIEEQMGLLVGERERIKEVITDSEGGFSLLGWVFRFINGYPDESINDDEEEALEDEVEEVLSDEGDENGTTDEGSDEGTDETTEEGDEEAEEEGTEETPEETTTP